jgi:deoxycytidylate deaminase
VAHCGVFYVKQRKINKCILIVIRINNNNELMNSIPCSFCCQKIKRYGIKHIICSSENGQIIKLSITELELYNQSRSERQIP